MNARNPSRTVTAEVTAILSQLSQPDFTGSLSIEAASDTERDHCLNELLAELLFGNTPRSVLLMSTKKKADTVAISLLCHIVGIDEATLREGETEGRDKELADAARKLKAANLWIDDSHVESVSSASDIILEQIDNIGGGLVVIDELRSLSRTQEAFDPQSILQSLSQTSPVAILGLWTFGRCGEQ